MCCQKGCNCPPMANVPQPTEYILGILPENVGPIDKSDSDEIRPSRLPLCRQILQELQQIGSIGIPIIVMGLLLYFRSMISMLFLGRIGVVELAGGSLAIGFANITGYSVLSGLATGMEPICGQAFGAKRWNLLGLALQRTILVLLFACLPISALWINVERILLWCGQDKQITNMARTYLLFCMPDLIAQAVLHPLRIYLRTQTITLPLMYCAALTLCFHLAFNYLLVHYFKLGIKGVALATAWSDFNFAFLLLGYLWISGMHKKSWDGWSTECLKDLKPLLSLAVPSCISVCLEWWWYELIILFSGFLLDPEPALAAMGILIQTTALLYIFPSSLSLAVSTRVANELGANRPEKARLTTLVALTCAEVEGILALIFTCSMRQVWGLMFTLDKRVLSLTSLVLPIIGLCELGNCPQTAGCGALRGSARPVIGASINLGSFYFVGMPVALLIGFLFKFGFVGFWLGLLAAQATCAMLMISALLKTDWNMQATRAKELTGAEVFKEEEIEVDEKRSLIVIN